jgi:hypothetical protein
MERGKAETARRAVARNLARVMIEQAKPEDEEAGVGVVGQGE